MKLSFLKPKPDGSGVTLFGVVLMLSIGGSIAFLLLWVIPNIRQEGLDRQRLLDVSSIKEALMSYIDNNDSIPKSLNDVQGQIDLDHYNIDGIFESLKSNEKIQEGLDRARQAAEEVKDYVGVFARSQCDQQWIENAANTNLLKSGSDGQIAILYVLEGKGLVCEQIDPPAAGEVEPESQEAGTDNGVTEQN